MLEEKGGETEGVQVKEKKESRSRLEFGQETSAAWWDFRGEKKRKRSEKKKREGVRADERAKKGPANFFAGKRGRPTLVSKRTITTKARRRK